MVSVENVMHIGFILCHDINRAHLMCTEIPNVFGLSTSFSVSDYCVQTVLDCLLSFIKQIGTNDGVLESFILFLVTDAGTRTIEFRVFIYFFVISAVYACISGSLLLVSLWIT